MTPVYAIGGYDLVVYALLLLAAIAMTSAWRLAWAVTGSASAATFAWAVVALGPPWIFNTFAVYPEVPAACAVALPDCTTNTLVLNAAANTWLWADNLHLGAQGHAQIGNAALTRAARNPF